MPKQPSLFVAKALLNAAGALAKLLEPIPNSDEIRSHLRGPFLGQVWEQETGRDYWLASDGRLVVCYTIAGLSLEQVIAIRQRWTEFSGSMPLSANALAAVIADTLDASVSLVQWQ